jgi:lysophospholipase L1-like esterase
VARRKAFRDRIDAYNTVLAHACQAYGPRCRYVAATHDAGFGIDELSTVDYFHPNAFGETRLAEVSWPGSFTWG